MLSEPVHSTQKASDIGHVAEIQVKEGVPKKTSDANTASRKREEAKLLQDVLEVAKQHFHASDIGLNFTVHEATGRIIVSVTDKETGDVIREIPQEEVLNLMAKLDEMMGIIFDKKA